MCKKLSFLVSCILVLSLVSNASAVIGQKDIDSPGIPGSATEVGGVWTVTGTGHDIWGGGDALYYVYRPVSGDGELVVDLTSRTMDPLHAWSKVGIMIRETSDTSSKSCAFVFTAQADGSGNEYQIAYRPETGGPSYSVDTSMADMPPRVDDPVWPGGPQTLGILRAGNTIQCWWYQEVIKGVLWVWQKLGQVDISMNSEVLIGMAVCSHNNSVPCTATFEDVNWPAVVYDAPWDMLPVDGAGPLGLQPTLSWMRGDSAVMHDIYLGTDPAALAHVATRPAGVETYITDPLAEGTRYYWQIVEQPGAIAGPIYNFKTMRLPPFGTIQRCIWEGIGGTNVSDLKRSPAYPQSPSWCDELTQMGYTDFADNYGGRMQGYLVPETSGDYTFWIAGDDSIELWLSPDEKACNLAKIAEHVGWTSNYNWFDAPEQQSAAIPLVANQKYFIRAFHKEGGGGDGCQVAWYGPDQPDWPVQGNSSAMINGYYLIPADDPYACEPNPIDGTTITPLEAAEPVTWTQGAGAVAHNVYAGPDPGSMVLVGTVAMPDTSIMLPPVAVGETVYWMVEADDGTQTYPLCAPWSYSVEEWASVDIGREYLSYPVGSSSYDESTGEYTISAGGDELWGNADQFHYLYTTMEMTRDEGMVQARVLGVTHLADWTRCGVQIRESRARGARAVVMSYTPAQRAVFQARQDTGGGWWDSYIGDEGLPTPQWVRITRQGNRFDGYYSSDGENWLHRNTAYVNMEPGKYVCIGLHQCHHNSAPQDQVSVGTADNLSAYTPDPRASWNPSPADGAENVPLEVTLSWNEGEDVELNMLYISQNYEDVLYGLVEPIVIPAGTAEYYMGKLELNKVYYWAVDEARREGRDLLVTFGNVWSFKIEPYRLLDDFEPYCVTPEPLPEQVVVTHVEAVPPPDQAWVEPVVFVEAVPPPENTIIEPGYTIPGYTIEAVPPAAGCLIAEWAFEGNYDDTSGSGFNGTPVGDANIVVDAERGNVLSLDGDGDYVDCGNPAALNFSTGNWSLSAWVKNTMTGTGDENKGAIIANGGDGGGGHRYCLILTEQQEGEVTLVTDDNVDKYQARGDITKVNDDVWHHVLGVRDGDVIRIYIDGVEEGSANLKAGYDLSGTSQANVLIGAMTLASDGSKYKDYGGLIDDAQIYNCALTEGNARYLAGLDDKVVPPVVVPDLYGPLLAHYEFEGNANDSTDNHYDGMLMGDANIVDGALVLDGDGDAVTIPGFKGVTGTNAFTISAWLKKTATEDSSIVCWGGSAGGTRVDFRLDNIRLRVEHGAGNIVGNTTDVVTDGEWHHVALTVKENATMSSTDLTLWLDGKDDTPDKTDTDAFNIAYDKDVGIGYRPTSNSRWYNGSIDDVRIYNYELSAGEIRYIGGHGNLEKPGYYSPCIVHWAMDEGSGDTVADSSGNDLHGAITDAAWTAVTADGSAACLDFNGFGGNVVNEAAGPYLNDLAGLSISMWIQSDLIDTDKGFIIGRNPEGNDQRGIRYDSVGASGGGDDVIKYGVACTDGADESESSVGIQTTAWQHVVMVWDNDGTGTDLYINGVLDAKSFDGDNRTGLTSGYTKLLAGKGSKDGAADAGWDGRIDDVRLYDYRLSEGEARYLAGVGDLISYQPLIGRWDAEGTADDSSGNENHGTPLGDATIIMDPVKGLVGSFDGDGDAINVGNNQLFNFTDDITIAAWVNLNSWGGNWGNVIVGKRGEGGVGWQLRRFGGDPRFSWTTRGLGNDDYPRSNLVPNMNQWYHLAAVREGTEKRLYIDGKLDSTAGVNAGPLNACPHDVYIGARANGGNTGPEAFFDGMVDELHIYNTALTIEQISGLIGCENPIENTWFSNGSALPQLDYEVVHWGKQSMKVEFGSPWQVMRIPPFADWTAGNAKALTMYFKGDAGNTPGQMYAQLGPDCTVEYPGSPEDLMNPDWQEWNIALADFPCGASSVPMMSVGVTGSSGVLRFDDMRLYPPRCVPALSSITDLNQDCSVNGKDLRILAADYLMGDFTVSPETPDAAGLLAHYEFNDNYDDSSGNGNHGTPVGAGITIEDDATMGKVLSLPGGDNIFVDCNGVGISGTMPRTIACWAKADHTSIPDWTLVFGFTGTEAGEGGCGSHFNIGSIGGPGGMGAHAWCWEETIFTDTEALDWRHYAMTYDGARILYYGDGVLMDTDPGKSNVIDLSIQADRLHIGSRRTQASSFPGKVDDARVYNYELSWGEIRSLAGLGDLYVPLDSIANIYDEEPANSKKVNLKDYALIGNDWLFEVVWP